MFYVLKYKWSFCVGQHVLELIDKNQWSCKITLWIVLLFPQSAIPWLLVTFGQPPFLTAHPQSLFSEPTLEDCHYSPTSRAPSKGSRWRGTRCEYPSWWCILPLAGFFNKVPTINWLAGIFGSIYTYVRIQHAICVVSWWWNPPTCVH